MNNISIVSPASAVKDEYIDGAGDFLTSRGFEVKVMPNAKGRSGSYAAHELSRAGDLRTAFEDLRTDIIFCARGGYGCNALLDKIPAELVRDNRKLIVGFSDVSALHAMMLKEGIPSLHGPMAKHLAEAPEGDPSSDRLVRMLRGERPEPFSDPSLGSDFNQGEAEGILFGGNLSVINGLASTPWDPFETMRGRDAILFIEDVNEEMHEVHRILTRLHLAGHLKRLKGMVVGQFTEYKHPDRNHPDMKNMIGWFLNTHGYGSLPVLFDFPAGHTPLNIPLMLGASHRLTVGRGTAILRQLD